MKITLYVYYLQYDWDEVGRLEHWDSRLPDSSDRFFIEEVVVDVPDTKIPSRDQIARIKVCALEKDRQEILAEMHMKLKKIDEKINELSALPNLEKIV